MIFGLMFPLLRAVPDVLAAGVATGQYRVSGSIIQSASSGQIVGHLQETSALPSMLGSLAGNSVLAPVSSATGVIDVVQNEQIKTSLTLVQNLQWANLALTGAGIGVSIACTAMMLHQINRLSRKVDDLNEQLAEVAKGIKQLQTEQLRNDFARMGTLVAQVDEAWSPGAQTGEWRDIARDAHFLADQFKSRALSFDAEATNNMREPFINAYALASNLRITARMAAGQDELAQTAARDRAEMLLFLGQPARLVSSMARPFELAAKPGTLAWLKAWRERQTELMLAATAAHERELQAAACIDTLAELAHQKIAGRDWLLAAREEREMPLVFLPVKGSIAV
jgi:hypothetical protein